MQNQLTCLHCGRNSDQVPLLALRYQAKDFWICPQHLPILIHEPAKLADKLPGTEILDSPDCHTRNHD